ncbi:MAG: AAA family ATPase [Candidatus Omnitrophica bacterium]|nr:AAA family ATPase [Candidatus Omnitrophota bacterium]
MVYKRISIDNFRCFSHFDVNSLKKFNLITGKNNIGKSAFLEAIFIMSGTHAQLMLATDIFRGQDVFNVNLSGAQNLESPLSSFFRNFNVANDIKFYAEKYNQENQTIDISVPPPSTVLMSTAGEAGNISLGGGFSQELCLFKYSDSKKVKFTSKIVLSNNKGAIGLSVEPTPPPVEFMTIYVTSFQKSTLEDVSRVGSLLRQGKKKELIDTLKVVDSRLQDLDIIPMGNKPVIHLKLLGIEKLLPLPLAGLGMARLLRYVTDIMNAPGGVVLIDEIEEGLHWSILNKVWETIRETCNKYDVQIFSTTHSFECVESAYNVFSKVSGDDLNVMRMEADEKNNVRAIQYDKNTLEAAIKNNLDIR